MIYVVGIVGVVFLSLCGLLKLEHNRFLAQKERAAAAEIRSEQEKAANATLRGSIDKLKGEYQASTLVCTNALASDAKAMAATSRILADLAAKDIDNKATIAQLRDEAAHPTPGTLDEKAARARDILRRYATDSLRD